MFDISQFINLKNEILQADRFKFNSSSLPNLWLSPINWTSDIFPIIVFFLKIIY